MKRSTHETAVDERERGRIEGVAEGQLACGRGGEPEADLGRMFSREGTTETQIKRGGGQRRRGRVERVGRA